MPRTKSPLWESSEIEKRILLHRDDLIVFNKPYDWPTSGHNLEDDDCVQYHLINYLREKGLITPTTKHPRGMVWAVHQLDADTTGLLLFTTNKKRVHHYHTQLASPETEKRYLAIVSGSPTWEQHTETTSIGKFSDGTRGALSETAGGQSARTDFTVLERHPSHTVLSARLHTGRTHQIRLHLQIMKHPLLGEEWYAPTPCKKHFRQALHAHAITSFKIPLAPTEEDLKQFLKTEPL